ncbi:MAG: SH3 domain-containing protein [Cyanobacteria bacterium P01_E01_bin.48]
MTQRRSQRPQRVFATWMTLLCLGVLAGALAGLGWKIWQLLSPLTQNPPLPEFAREVRERDSAQAAQIAEPPGNNTPAPLDPSVPRAPEPLAARPENIPPSLPDGTKARVVEPIGLLVKAEPSVESATLGGAAMNETVVVLGLSDDGVWQRIRRDVNEQEGWVKGQNLLPL